MEKVVVSFRAARWLRHPAADHTVNASNGTANLTCNPLLEIAKVEGDWIPIVFGINLAAAALFLVLFALLNCFCKDYIRIAYFKNNRRWPPLLPKATDHADTEKGDEMDESMPLSRSRRRGSSMHQGQNCWHSFRRYLTMREDGVRRRCGPDAALYLTMQLHLIGMLVIYTLLSIVVILPINYVSGEQENGFSRTTIGNLNPSNSILWSHVVMAIVYLIIAGVFMLHYSLRLGRSQHITSGTTVQIEHIPQLVHVEDLMQHMEDIMPGAQIIDIRFAYDVRDLTNTWSKLKTSLRHLEAAESYELEKGKTKYISQKFCCICGQVNAKEFYNDEQKRLKYAVMLQSSGVFTKKLHIAYVTFKNQEDAQKFIRSHHCPYCRPQSLMSDSINSSWWSVSLAPFPRDIIWENLATPKILWWLRWIAINLCLVVLLFFFTTPAILLATVEDITVILFNYTKLNNFIKEQNLTIETPPVVKDFLATFILWLLRSVMVFLVMKSCSIEGHWSRSAKEKNIFRKLYVFQLIMIVVLPIMGLTSLNAIAQLVFRGKNGQIIVDRLSCAYLPNNGAFFITYILIAIFIGNTVELVRLPELCEYILFRALATTRVEKEHSLKRIARYEFAFGAQYANNLLIFAITMAFSLSCPIIVPCGLVYFVFKYMVDKYNLLYAYQNISASGRQYLHQTAMRFVIMALISLQLATLFFTLVRGGGLSPRAIFLIVTIVLTTVCCFAVLALGWLSFLLPQVQTRFNIKAFNIFGNLSETEVPEPGSYIPPVLRESTDDNQSDPSSVASSYESFGRKLASGAAMDKNKVHRRKKRPSVVRESVLAESLEEVEGEDEDDEAQEVDRSIN